MPYDENSINLDGYATADELWEFWKLAHRLRPTVLARRLFPARPKGYVAATHALSNYASNKATAMSLRAEGHIQAAIQYETICESIYNGLPQFARW